MELNNSRGSIPLYMQIKAILVEKISAGEWAPGSVIPSEMQLAAQLSVSHGTVRKAITELVESNILLRRQGKGTFVAIHDDARALFHFFHIADDKGVKVLPESRTLSCRRKRAPRLVASRLDITPGSTIIAIERVRSINKQAAIAESIYLPSGTFGDFAGLRAAELPNTLYTFYENRFGVTIHKAEEQLRAIISNEQDASLLGLTPGAPLLEIERTAFSLAGTPVELRISRCNTGGFHYANTII